MPRLLRSILILPRNLGAFRYGTPIHPSEIPEIDLVVVGSAAVSVYGERLGKGEGYSELEYSILREFNKVSEETPITTTIHDVQVVDFHIPLEPWDFTIDYIFTPTKSIKREGEKKRPPGLLWQHLDRKKKALEMRKLLTYQSSY